MASIVFFCIVHTSHPLQDKTQIMYSLYDRCLVRESTFKFIGVRFEPCFGEKLEHLGFLTVN